MKKNIFLVSFMAATALSQGANAQWWDLNGNAGTNPSNFIGTVDLQPIRFKVDNQNSGIIDHLISTGGTENTALGYMSLQANAGTQNSAFGALSMNNIQGGVGNIAVGLLSMSNNVSGQYNIGIGTSALQGANTGSGNVAVGQVALLNNISGSLNVALGWSSLGSNTAGSQNIAIGNAALGQNTTVSGLVAIGTYALSSNTTGTYNTAIGTSALELNTNGYWNTSVGNNSLANNVDGARNTSVGHQALYRNSSGGGNTGLGWGALYGNTTGHSNTAVGDGSMDDNSTGFFNAALGHLALERNTTGFGNTAVGASAGITVTTGSRITAIGQDADASANVTNATAIGYQAFVNASNKLVLGNPNVVSIVGYNSVTITSDARYKKNIKEDVPGIEFIKMLRPVTYTMDTKKLNNYYDGLRDGSSKTKKSSDNDEEPASKLVRTGFLAQEVNAAAEKLNYDFSGVDRPQDESGVYGLRYSDFVPPLVKAVQEQQQLIEELQVDRKELIQQNQMLLERLEKIEQRLSSNAPSQSDAPVGPVELGQNTPNPFTSQTAINYTMKSEGTVDLVLLDAKGVKIRNLERGFRATGAYSYVLDGRDLQPGTYYYVIYVNGSQVTKAAIKL